jgi:hypothetical protein
MLTYEEFEELLKEVTLEIPEDLFRFLNGGVNPVHDIRMHPESDGTLPLYVLGHYHHDPRGLGRYITVYYGSFVRIHSYLSPERQKEELRKIVRHEFRHHIESLAGERDLEIEDAQDLAKYRFRKFQKYDNIRPQQSKNSNNWFYMLFRKIRKLFTE